VSALITGSAIRTCLGAGEKTFSALLERVTGVADLRYVDTFKLNVTRGYHVAEDGGERLFRASSWLTGCVEEALAQARVDPERQRVVAIVGTGLRELRAVERSAVELIDFPAERLHFASAVQRASPHIREIVTISNACSAGGHALALAQDLIELGEADAVVAAGADGMTESMLAMIGRISDAPTDLLRPFDTDRTGTLLGEGAAALIVVAEGPSQRPLARLLSTGLSCDANHETSPDPDGIRRAMEDALSRAARSPSEIDLVVAHGTGTLLNDQTEAHLIHRIMAADGPGPLVTAVKGSVGHTSGASALVSVDVAIRCLHRGLVPPIVGLHKPLCEGQGLRFVLGESAKVPLRLVCINAFGFGGVNAVTLIEAAT
jgi:3-oxoacyl-[acyl-carrier-protein] synthase II